MKRSALMVTIIPLLAIAYLVLWFLRNSFSFSNSINPNRRSEGTRATPITTNH
jgi:hypothetical protein